MNANQRSVPSEQKPNPTNSITRRQIITTILAVALTETVLRMIPVSLPPSVRMFTLILATGLLSGIGTVLNLQTLNHRIRRLAEITRAWQRGSLSVRLNDSDQDMLGTIADHLDLLIENLEENEQDLNRIRASNARLTDQVRALAVVEERNRLARELHDSVKQHLFSLAMTASAVRIQVEGLEEKPPTLIEMVEEIEASAQTAQQQTTRMIDDLRPAPLQIRRLANAINDYTLIFGAREHLLVYFDENCGDFQFSPPIKEALYRVTQEALHNVARHARATRVDVKLSCRGSRVGLSVEDNGIGFEPQQTPRGLGISNMHERLLEIGGRLQIESQPGAGTVVRAEIEVTPETGERLVPAFRTQSPDPDAWSWLAQRLVIPVGQTWPWLPVDEERHLRDPLVEPIQGVLELKSSRRWLSLRRTYTLEDPQAHITHLTLHRDRDGYEWHTTEGNWSLKTIGGLRGRSILVRNEQPLAAMQYRGRQLDTWTEIIYDSALYQLRYRQEDRGSLYLVGPSDAQLLKTDTRHIRLNQACPAPLLAMVTSRVIDEFESLIET